MGIRSEPSSTSVSKSNVVATTSAEGATRGDELVLYEGHWYKPISPDQAARIRKDIPLYAREKVTRGFHLPLNIEDMRYVHDGVCKTTLWKSYLWHIRVDPPDREEYVPNG